MAIVIATLMAGIISAAATAMVAIIRGKREYRRQEDQRVSDISAFLDGVPAVPGVTDGASSAALRMMKVENGLSDVARGQALLEQRMNEANGTGKRTEEMVKAIISHLGMATP